MSAKWKGAVTLVLLLIGIAGVLVWQQAWGRYTVTETIVRVEPGMGSPRVADRLQQAGVISSATVFRWLARLTGEAGALKVGEYRFAGETSTAEVLAKISRGEVVRHQVTVPEGLRTDEIVTLLARETGMARPEWQAALEQLLPQGEPEGRLLPETYDYTWPLRPEVLLRQMRQAQQALLAKLGVKSTKVAERLRIIASIIEKETARDAERPLVASVIENRLQRHMPLQMDPTVIYGIWRRDGSFSGNLHKQDMHRDTPWNSYTRRGLPPTPICNPGAASLRAAAHPADSDFLYFVADGSGGHAFAATLKEHAANVARWIKIERQQQTDER